MPVAATPIIDAAAAADAHSADMLYHYDAAIMPCAISDAAMLSMMPCCFA